MAPLAPKDGESLMLVPDHTPETSCHSQVGQRGGTERGNRRREDRERGEGVGGREREEEEMSGVKKKKRGRKKRRSSYTLAFLSYNLSS